MLQQLVKRPIGAMVIAVAVMVLGTLAWQRLGVALLPPVESPIITVRAERSGSSAMELEEQVLEPLQDLLATLPGLVAMQGRAASEQVEVQLALGADADVGLSIERLRERLASWRRPRGLNEPRILRYDPGSEPLLRLLLRAKPGGADLSALAVAAREDLLPRLEGRPDVASALLRGFTEMEMRVVINDAALRGAGLDISAVSAAIRDGVESRSVGSIRTADGSRQINLRGPATLPEHLPQLPLPGGLRLSDVAEFRWQTSDSEELTVALNAGRSEETLVIEVLAQASAAVVAAADDVRQTLDHIARPTGPQRWDFAGGELILLADRSAPIRTAIDEVVQAMIVGSLLAGAVLLLFLRSFSAALVVFLSVPLSVAGAFLVLANLGVGINLMSMGGLALGIGMLVDNAIVVIESARRRLGSQTALLPQRQQAVAAGTGEVASAVIAATATTLAVFLPLIYAPGILGDLLLDLAVAVAASLGASLMVALVITPPLLTLGAQRKGLRPSLPSIHAGYHSPLTSAARQLWWWALSLLPWAALISLPWAPPVTWIASAWAGIWLVIASAWLWQTQREPATIGHWLAALPLRLGNLALAWLRWWLVAIALAPLWVVAKALRLLSAIIPLRPLLHIGDRSLTWLGRAVSNVYAQLLHRVLAHPLLAVLIMVSISAAGLWSLRQLDLRLLPASTHRQFVMEVTLPRGLEVDQSRDWATSFLTHLTTTQPDLEGIAIAGEDPRFAPTLERRQAHQLQLLLIRAQREASPQAEEQWLAHLEQQALTHGALSAAAWPPPLFTIGANEQSALAIALRGGDTVALRQQALRWQASLRLMGARGVRSSANDHSEEVLIVARSQQLQEAGITWSAFQERLRAASEVVDVDGFRPRYDGLTPSPTILPIRIHGVLRESPLSALADLDIGDQQRPLPLSAVASIERIPSMGIIRHRDGKRVATLSATALPPGMDLTQTLAALQAQQPLAEGMSVVSYGLETITGEHLQALLGILVLAVFLVLVVMAVQFEDLSQPLLVLLSVPMAVAGALPCLWLLGHDINVMSAIGLVVLAGIAVNNAIVLVTTVNLRRAEGMDLKEALHNAATTRLRPIAMTSLTTILALFPLAIGWGEAAELRAPLAVAVIGGMISSTILILLALPGVMALFGWRKLPDT